VRNARESHILRLPGEIRNSIYYYVLQGELYAKSPGRHIPIERSERKNRLALLASYRQVQQETALLPYKLCTIHFSSGQFRVLSFNLSLAKRQAIRSIHLDDIGSGETDDIIYDFAYHGFTPLSKFLPNLRLVTVEAWRSRYARLDIHNGLFELARADHSTVMFGQ
jgi:hypothetical protein